jgi:hypothetical protein
MSAISGETTRPMPSRISDGIWKQSDLPPPVGISTSESRRASAASMIARWWPRNSG